MLPINELVDRTLCAEFQAPVRVVLTLIVILVVVVVILVIVIVIVPVTLIVTVIVIVIGIVIVILVIVIVTVLVTVTPILIVIVILILIVIETGAVRDVRLGRQCGTIILIVRIIQHITIHKQRTIQINTRTIIITKIII